MDCRSVNPCRLGEISRRECADLRGRLSSTGEKPAGEEHIITNGVSEGRPDQQPVITGDSSNYALGRRISHK